MSQTIYISLASGIGNRLFVLGTALLVARNNGRDEGSTTINYVWGQKAGRIGMDYVGPMESKFSDFLEDIPGVNGIGSLTTAEIEKIKIENGEENVSVLDNDVFDHLNVGRPIGFKAIKTPTPEIVARLNTRKIVNGSKNVVVVKGLQGPYNDKRWSFKLPDSYPGIRGIITKDIGMEQLSKVFKDNFVPKKLDLVNKVWKGFADSGDGGKIIGVHVRKTDMEDFYSQQRPGSYTTLDDWMQLVASTMKTWNKSKGETRIFLATDDPTGRCLKTFRERFGVKRVLHYDNDAKFVNSVEGSKLAMVDMFLLSRCNVLLGSCHSSFSLSAFMLSDVKSIRLL